MKICTIVGARPQFIKAAALSHVVAQHPEIQEVIIHTGQHYDANMSDVFFTQLGIPEPDYNLNIGGGNHGAMTGRQLEALEKILLSEKPDWVLVYGDTNSTLAGALAAAKLHIPVAHVEAGMRSFDKQAPEEINRIIADHISSALLVSTTGAAENLANEGITGPRVQNVGDIMFDAALLFKAKAEKPDWANVFDTDQPFALATIHRAVNTDDPEKLRSIFAGLAGSSARIVLPLHPRTKQLLAMYKVETPDNVVVCPPAGYLEMVWLEKNAYVILTDSGGVQKEAYFHNRPCITLRDETEWTELVSANWNVLVGADTGKIIAALQNPPKGDANTSFYGTGNAATQILEHLKASNV